MHEQPRSGQDSIAPDEDTSQPDPQLDPLLSSLPGIPIAGSVASEEEAFRVQQIATITRWLRRFTEAAHQTLPEGPSSPQP